MGCKHSAPVEQKTFQKVMDRPKSMSPPVAASTYDISPETLMRMDVSSVIHCVEKIPMPKTSSPVSCITETSCPIILAPFHFKGELGREAQYMLPIIALSRIEFGRVLCLGSFEILSLCDENNKDYVLFLEKMMRWAGGPTPEDRNVLVSKHLGPITEGILYNLRNLGFGFEIMKDDSLNNFSKYSFLILESSFPKTDGIFDYIMNGGGLICGASPSGTPNRFNMNSVISKAGIGFPNANFELIPYSFTSGEENFFQVSFNFDNLWCQNLPSMIQNAQKLFSTTKGIDVQKIDSILTILRYDIELLNVGQCPELVNLGDSAVSYLQNTNYEKDGMICAEETQSIVALAATESFLKMTAQELSQFDVGSLFPGITNQYLDEKVVQVTLKDNKWHSIGLWLPAGVVSFISFIKYTDNILIQVGSHPDFIVDKIGPWKRWPSVTLTFEVVKPQIEISSPYGGMVYFLTKEKNFKKSLKFTASFTDICKYPMYNIKKPKKWEKAADYLVPWAEIICTYVIFTVPSHIAKSSPNMDEFAHFADEMINHIKNFLMVTFDELHFRVVFDVELPKEGFICGYPIVLDINTAPAIFGPISPSKELFLLLTIISLTSLPENIFPHQFEIALASITAVYCFSKKWPKCDPLSYSEKSDEPLFKYLYEIFKSKGESLFLNTNNDIRQNLFNFARMDQLEAFNFYLKTLSKNSKEDYKFIIETNDNSDKSDKSPFFLNTTSDS